MPAEISNLVAQGYSNEGVSFYACEAGERNISRLVNGTTFLLVEKDSSEYNAALGAGYKFDSTQFAISSNGSTPVFRLRKPTGNYLYTVSPAERDAAVANYGYAFEGVAFYGCQQNDKPLFRLYHAAKMKHFYTVSSSERDAAGTNGYQYEGPILYIPPTANGTPVYRLVKDSTSSYFYTTSVDEKNTATASGYRYEGVAFSVAQHSASSPVYRLYSPTRGTHFYTTSKTEANNLPKTTFTYEGVGFNGRP